MNVAIGMQIGSLVIVGVTKARRGYVATCECSCGKVVRVPSARLVEKVRSCGNRLCDRRFRASARNGDGKAIRINRGYREVLIHRHWIGEHRLVVEKRIGRKLRSYEHIHHINGDVQDNRLENLAVVNASEHSKKHADLLREVARLAKDNELLREKLRAQFP